MSPDEKQAAPEAPVVLWAPVTRWRLAAISNWPGRLDVTLAVDSTAPMVVNAIENAAAHWGVDLERLKEGEQP
jgi:hypothetical protein